MASIRAASPGGQIRLTSDPNFHHVLGQAQAILECQSGRPARLRDLVRPALEYIAQLEPADLETVVLRLDVSKSTVAGAVRLDRASREMLDILCDRPRFARTRKHSRSDGVWSTRALLVTALFAYAEFVIRKNQ